MVGEDIGVSLEEEIKSLLNNFEPRIKLTQVNIEDDIDENGLYITIRYNIVGLPFPEQNIEFLLQPSRI